MDKDTAAELLEHAKTVKSVVDKYLESLPLEDALKPLASNFTVKSVNKDVPIQ